MNSKKRIAYQKKIERRQNAFARQYMPGMITILRDAFKGAGDALKRGKVEEYLNSPDFMPTLGRFIMDMYEEVGVYFAALTLREIEAEEKKDITDDWILQIIENFRLYLLSKAVLPIQQTTRMDILRILEKGVAEGWGIDKMVFELDHTELSVTRARTIVRTELHKAQFEGRKLGEEWSEWETDKIWIAAEDNRTRNSHRKMDNMKIDTDDKFQVPKQRGGFELMDGPGDPEASAENVINCRCTLAHEARRDQNGRLIKKRRISVISQGEVARVQQRQVVTI